MIRAAGLFRAGRLLAQRAAEQLDGLHNLLRPTGDFVVAQGALGGLEADAQEE